MTRKGSQNFVQTLDTVRTELLVYHIMDGKTWREISALNEYSGIPAGTLCAISKGRDPKNSHVRAQLHLPALIPAPSCSKCGKVHVSKRCTDNVKPARRAVWVRVLGHAGSMLIEGSLVMARGE